MFIICIVAVARIGVLGILVIHAHDVLIAFLRPGQIFPLDPGAILFVACVFATVACDAARSVSVISEHDALIFQAGAVFVVGIAVHGVQNGHQNLYSASERVAGEGGKESRQSDFGGVRLYGIRSHDRFLDLRLWLEPGGSCNLPLGSLL